MIESNEMIANTFSMTCCSNNVIIFAYRKRSNFVFDVRFYYNLKSSLCCTSVKPNVINWF